MEQLASLKEFAERHPWLASIGGALTLFLLALLYFYQRKTDLTGTEFIYMDF